MKNSNVSILFVGVVVGVLLSCGPVLASEIMVMTAKAIESEEVEVPASFQTLSGISVGPTPLESFALNPLTDSQLAEIKGARHFGLGFGRPPGISINLGFNIGVTNQFNICGICIGSSQSIRGKSFQSLIFR